MSLPIRCMPFLVQIGLWPCSQQMLQDQEGKEDMKIWNLAWEQMMGRGLTSYPLFMHLCVCVQSFQCHKLSLMYQFCHFSQVTNSLISTYETTVDITEADVNVTVMYMRLQNLLMNFFCTCFWSFTSASLSFISMSLNVICRLYVTFCCSNIDAIYAYTPRTLTFMC